MWLAGFATLLLIASVLPLLPLSHGIARSFDFPRVQICVLAVVTLVAAIPLGGISVAHALASALCLAVLAVQLPWVLPYTPLWPKQSVSVDAVNAEHGASVRLLIANVLQDNRQFHRLVDMIERSAPDIVVLMEVDDEWKRGLAETAATYPHRLDAYQDNTYGMTLWSRLPWRVANIQCLVKPGIPSIVAQIALPNGEDFLLYCVHPEPPDPVSDTAERDAEIVLVGLDAKKSPLPAVVTGDLNDVAWSRTTQRFLRLSGLVDPRIGRGMYNSFHAAYPFLRWPLDQLFHDPRFLLKSIRRMPSIGSDHFPVLFELTLLARPAATGSPNGIADETDVAEARSLLDETKSARTASTALLTARTMQG